MTTVHIRQYTQRPEGGYLRDLYNLSLLEMGIGELSVLAPALRLYERKARAEFNKGDEHGDNISAVGLMAAELADLIEKEIGRRVN
jgi:hypothetical protein